MAVASITLFLTANAAAIQKGLDQAKSNVQKFEKNISSSIKQASSSVSQSLNVMTGGLSGMAEAGLKAFSGMTKGLKGLNAAFVSTGIGAIIIAITTAVMGLVAAFKRSGSAGDEIAKVMGYLKGVFDALIGILVKVGEWLIKAFKDPKGAIKELWEAIKENLVTRFQGVIQLFQGGWEIIKNGAIGVALAIKGIFDKDAKEQAKQYFDEAAKGAGKVGEALLMISTGKTVEDLKEFGKTLNDAGKEGIRLAELEDSLMDQKIKNTVELQRLETQLVQTREQLAETGVKSEEDRQKRLELYNKALQQMEAISARRIAFAKQEYELVKAQAEAANDTSDETRLKIAEAQARYEAEITKSVQETLKFKKGETTVQQQLNAEVEKQIEAEKSVQDQIRQLNAETAILKIKDEKEAAFARLKLEEENALAAVENVKGSEELKQAIRDQYWQKGLNLAYQYYDENKALADQQVADQKAADEAKIAQEEATQQALQEKRQAYADMASSLVNSISLLQQASMNKELEAAGDNEAKKEAIKKKYAKKEKQMAIIQAIINGAVAFTKALSQGGIFGIALGAITALATAAQIAVIKSQPLAKGGIAYGETLATVGEYPGARTNPEVIAPLDRLKKLIGSTSEMGEVKFVIEQNQLVGILQKANNKNIYF